MQVYNGLPIEVTQFESDLSFSVYNGYPFFDLWEYYYSAPVIGGDTKKRQEVYSRDRFSKKPFKSF